MIGPADAPLIAAWLLPAAGLAALHARAWSRSAPLRFEEGGLGEGGEGVPESGPLVSFLVPAWNAADDLAAFVAAFRALSYRDRELVLCAGGPDGSLEAARALAGPDVTVLEQRPGQGKQGALRDCLAAARGRIVYLTDVDCRPDDASFTRVLRPVLEGREQVVTGSSRPVDAQLGIGAVRVHWALVRKAEGDRGGYANGILGRNCVVTREALAAIGGFGFEAPTGTDYRLAQELRAAGYRIRREPASEIPTEYAWPLATYARKRGRWVRNVLLFGRRPEERAERRNALSVALLPALLLLAAPASLLALALLPPAAALLPLWLATLLYLHGGLARLRYVREALGPDALDAGAVRGAFSNWTGQLWAGLHALVTTIVPDLRKQW